MAGHRLQYAVVAAEVLLGAGLSPELALSDEGKRSAELRQARPAGDLPVMDVQLIYEAGFRSRFGDLRRLRNSQSDGWVFTNSDEYLLPLALTSAFRRLPQVRCLVMRPPRSSSLKDRVKRACIGRLESKGCRVWELRSPYEARSSDVDCVLDPSGLAMSTHGTSGNPVAAALASWRGEDTRPIVCVVGVQSPRKCIAELLEAAEAHGGFRVVLAGKPDSAEYEIELIARTKTMPDDLAHLELRILSEDELDSVLDVSDAVALLYSNAVGSSGILNRAISHRVPVIAWGNDTVVDVAKSGAGIVATGLDVGSLSDAVLRAAASRNPFLDKTPDLTTVMESWNRWLVE